MKFIAAIMLIPNLLFLAAGCYVFLTDSYHSALDSMIIGAMLLYFLANVVMLIQVIRGLMPYIRFVFGLNCLIVILFIIIIYVDYRSPEIISAKLSDLLSMAAYSLAHTAFYPWLKRKEKRTQRRLSESFS